MTNIIVRRARKTQEKCVSAGKSRFKLSYILHTIYYRRICNDGRPQEQHPSGEYI